MKKTKSKKPSLAERVTRLENVQHYKKIEDCKQFGDNYLENLMKYYQKKTQETQNQPWKTPLNYCPHCGKFIKENKTC